MTVWALGINHQSAPLDVRGCFSFAIEQVPTVLQGLKAALQHVPEATLLSTCNRTEIYGASDDLLIEPALHWLAQTANVAPDVVRSHAYQLEGDAVARHAFRVASGLDSMVLGEPQILGQMKAAVQAAQDAGTMGSELHQLFQRSFAIAKQVRSTTDIGAHSISMAAAAVRLAAQLFESLQDIRVLFVGAGEMIELTATHFAAQNPKHMAIANRSIERAQALAQQIGVQQVLHLADLPQHLHEFDAVISCTASTLPIIGLGAVERAIKARKHQPMFMVDLAVPRDIEAQVAELDDVYLYTVDDLAQVVQTGKAHRQAAVAQAEVLISEGVLQFNQWQHQRRTVPLIQQIQQQAHTWRQAELTKARKQLAKGDPIDAVLEQLAHGLSQKMLHGTMTQLQAHPSSAETAAMLSRIYLGSNLPMQSSEESTTKP